MFAIRLRQLRDDSRITQSKLSNNVQISERTIRRYESGEIQPNAAAIVKLCEYFNVSSDYLLGLSNNPKRND